MCFVQKKISQPSLAFFSFWYGLSFEAVLYFVDRFQTIIESARST